MDPERLAIEARLIALEFFMVRMFAAMTRSMSAEQFDRISDNWVQGIERQTFPGIEGAGSDEMTAEVRARLVSLLESTKEVRKPAN